MLASMKHLLHDAKQARCAVGAFNVENAEMVRAAASAASELNCPLVFQTTPSTLRFLPPSYFVFFCNGSNKGVWNNSSASS